MVAVFQTNQSKSRLKSGRWLRPLAIGFAMVSLGVQTAEAQVVVTTLASFGGTNGSSPNNGMIQASDRCFYGTTYTGGESTDYNPNTYNYGYGTVFKLTPEGALTSLVSFNGTNGDTPRGGLVQGADGGLYGTTWFGGVSNRGTIFRVTTNGEFTSLISFVGTNGAWPQSSLVRGNDDFLYGTTRLGGLGTYDLGYGVPGDGTVFKVSTNGVLTTLYSFGPDANGMEPFAPLVLAGDGMFYGTALSTTNNSGTIFKTDAAGNLSLVVVLDFTNGLAPYGGLIQASDGNFYGLSVGLSSGVDLLLRIDTNGALTTLCSFSTGGAPFSNPIEAPDGNFYGTLPYGECFQATRTGHVNYPTNADGATDLGLVGSLVLGSDGSFYGAAAGGDSDIGRIVRLTIPEAARPLLQGLKLSATNIAFKWVTLPGRGYQVQCSTNLSDTNWSNLGDEFVATNRTASVADSLAGGPQRFYRVVLLP